MKWVHPFANWFILGILNKFIFEVIGFRLASFFPAWRMKSTTLPFWYNRRVA